MFRPRTLAIATTAVMMSTGLALILAQNVRSHHDDVTRTQAVHEPIETNQIVPADVFGGPRWVPLNGESSN